MIADIPLSLYIHMPWCIKKCPYCDFNSHVARHDITELRYIDALLKDIENFDSLQRQRPIQSVFIGGGTPSLFSPDSYDKLFHGLKQKLHFMPDIEVTMEMNPGTHEYHELSHYREAGVNRLSLGIQSFDRKQLKTLGRIHNPEESDIAIHKAIDAGFDRINLDLMYALPQQSVASAIDDLTQALRYDAVTHLSWYQLTLEPGTHFYKIPPKLPSDDISFEMEAQGRQLLAQAGFNRYEISAYTKQQDHCQHNLNYWHFGDYLGIGAGAHSKLTDTDGNVHRQQRHKHPERYMDSPHIDQEQIIAKDMLPFEYLMNKLRLFERHDFKAYEKYTSHTTESLIEKLLPLKQRGLIEHNESSFWLTEQGEHFLNDVLETFLPAQIKPLA